MAGAFWKDLAAWRRHPAYDEIRRDIARLVLRRAQGADGGDAPFTGGDRWAGIFHAHISSKLILFTGYPDEGTMKLCALVKHDAYGFRNERKSLAGTFAARMRRLVEADPVPRPEWGSLRWRDPGDIPNHPELREMSRDGLEALLNDILDEQDSFEGAWLDALVAAQAAVENLIIERVRPQAAHLEVSAFEVWAPSP